MESHGPEYWNAKWERSPIIYRGRALRGEHYNKMISIDVRTFIDREDEIIRRVIDAKNLLKSNYNETALECQKFVCEFLTYKYDEVNVECPEFWQFPFETLQSTVGDCEDGAILTAGLIINAGIPYIKGTHGGASLTKKIKLIKNNPTIIRIVPTII